MRGLKLRVAQHPKSVFLFLSSSSHTITNRFLATRPISKRYSDARPETNRSPDVTSMRVWSTPVGQTLHPCRSGPPAHQTLNPRYTHKGPKTTCSQNVTPMRVWRPSARQKLQPRGSGDNPLTRRYTHVVLEPSRSPNITPMWARRPHACLARATLNRYLPISCSSGTVFQDVWSGRNRHDTMFGVASTTGKDMSRYSGCARLSIGDCLPAGPCSQSTPFSVACACISYVLQRTTTWDDVLRRITTHVDVVRRTTTYYDVL